MRVLIVENQPERLAMLVPALEAAGCVVTATLNSARSLDVQISRLRKMLEPDPAQPRYIQTVWGVGYVFVPDGTQN